ncbi:hypothetical protein [Brevibacterium aurantiacum]|uniref:Uncharacterized protein n=1 Tax=Brevibacterium aurantiacum TaxID=273384 RepID=A0A3Q9NWF2_BREAU|nr:hypothetical protein [Brevibacterium aurantiacum]AZT94176.1 hypothetical protein CXR23_14300 [Brevibacterium aurantiacum]AZT97983.1 hypothetical protein CXR27_13990 [Brevibacterium aurantiacum]
MSKPISIIVAGAIGFAAIVIILVIVFQGSARIPDMPPDRSRYPEQALTPEEITVNVTPRSDGSLQVSQRLIFDVTDEMKKPLSWYIGGEQIGWNTGVGDGPRYYVLPQVGEVSAQELSTAEGSTKENPAEVGDLTVTRENRSIDDPFSDSAVYDFTREKQAGEDSQWTPGRHVVDITYVLDDVYLNVDGHELFVLPLRFPSGSNEAPSMRTVSLEAGGPIQCLPDHTEFDPDAECTGLDKHRFTDDGTRLTWSEETSPSIEAIGFAAPENMQAEPIDAPERERS